jgi:TetR/AcrR family transcriptional regulator, transcriptional repressor for nem operon
MKNTKNQILYESFKLFLAYGFHSVTMNDLVKASGLSKGAFYHYFASKEALFRDSIVEFFFTGLTERKFVPSFMASVQENMNNLIDFKANAYRQLLKATSLDKLDNAYFSLLFESLKMFPEFRETLGKSLTLEEDTMAEIFIMGIENGELRKDLEPSALASMLSAMLDGAELHSVVIGNIEHLHTQEKQIAEDFYNLIKIH